MYINMTVEKSIVGGESESSVFVKHTFISQSGIFLMIQ